MNDKRSESTASSVLSSRSLSASSRETTSSATMSALAAMESRLVGLKNTDDYTRKSKMMADLFELKNNIMKLTKEYRKLGRKYKEAKATRNVDEIEDMKEERNMVKKQVRMYTQQYIKLKVELGYESASCSSAASSDDDDLRKDD